jgi:hypothetical protein
MTASEETTLSTNEKAIFAFFEAIGIAEEDIAPTENVFSYDAWQEQGRQVVRGSKGCPTTKWRDTTDEATGEIVRRPLRVYKFHRNQTKDAAEADPEQAADEA